MKMLEIDEGKLLNLLKCMDIFIVGANNYLPYRYSLTLFGHSLMQIHLDLKEEVILMKRRQEEEERRGKKS